MKIVTVSAIALLPLFFASSSVAAQSRRDRTNSPSAQQILESFERVWRGERGSLNPMSSVLTDPSSFPAAKVDSLLNGLEMLAMSASEQRVQIMALSWLAGAGRGGVSPVIPGIAGRLARVYDRAASVQVRRSALRQLGSQADQESAARILRNIAQQDSASQRAPNAAHDAIWGLTELGAPGTAVLRDLHSRRLLRDPEARSAIQQVARQRGWQRVPRNGNR